MAEGLYIENGKWVAIYRDLEGRQRSKTFPLVRTLTEAKKARRRLLADLEARRIAPASVITVATLADQWLASRKGRVRARTFETDTRYVALVKAFFGRGRVQDTTPADVERFLAALRAGAVGASGRPLAEWTTANALKTLRMIMNKAVLDGTIAFNPAAASRLQSHSRPRQVNARQPVVLTAAQVNELVAAAVKKTPSYAGVIATAAYTGARIREVLAIRWSDIDQERKLIHLRGQINVAGTAIVAMKTIESERFVALVPKLEQYLGRQGRMAARWSADDDFVFSASRHRPKDYGNLRRALAIAARRPDSATCGRTTYGTHSSRTCCRTATSPRFHGPQVMRTRTSPRSSTATPSAHRRSRPSVPLSPPLRQVWGTECCANCCVAASDVAVR